MKQLVLFVVVVFLNLSVRAQDLTQKGFFELSLTAGHTFVRVEEQGHFIEATFKYRMKKFGAGIFFSQYSSLLDRNSIKRTNIYQVGFEYFNWVGSGFNVTTYRVHQTYQAAGVELIYQAYGRGKLSFDLGSGIMLAQSEGTLFDLDIRDGSQVFFYEVSSNRTLGITSNARVLYRISGGLNAGVQLRFNHGRNGALLSGIVVAAEF